MVGVTLTSDFTQQCDEQLDREFIITTMKLKLPLLINPVFVSLITQRYTLLISLRMYCVQFSKQIHGEEKKENCLFSLICYVFMFNKSARFLSHL